MSSLIPLIFEIMSSGKSFIDATTLVIRLTYLWSYEATFGAFVRSRQSSALFTSPEDELSTGWTYKLNSVLLGNDDMSAPNACWHKITYGSSRSLKKYDFSNIYSFQYLQDI